jgi:hypothetical protein
MCLLSMYEEYGVNVHTIPRCDFVYLMKLFISYRYRLVTKPVNTTEITLDADFSYFISFLLNVKRI